MTDTAARKIAVYAHRAGEAVAILTKLAKKANRWGKDPVTFILGEEYTVTKEYKDWDGETRRVRLSYRDIVISGDRVKIGNHEFLARIEHTDAGNLIQVVPDTDVTIDPRFRASDPYCAHCKTRRLRKDTFIVLNRATGEQAQIGRNCLQDYLGIDPAQAISKCAFAFLSGDGFEREFGSGGWDWSETLEWVLTATATSIRIDGWLSKGEAAKLREGGQDHIATAAKVSALWSHSKNKDVVEGRKRLIAKITADDKALAQTVIAWVRSDALAANNDYIHNLKVVCAKDVLLEARHVGLACSAVAAYNRAQEIETRRRAELQTRKDSKHVGAKGERLRDVKATLLSAKGLGENGYGQWQVLYKFLTIEGDVLTWITSSELEIAQGRAVLITGTVKDHRDWQGLLETRISRAIVSEVENGNHRVQ